jgi:hypothetical protein
VGLLLQQHTGRIRLFAPSASPLFAQDLDALRIRLNAAPAVVEPPPQADLFG